MSISHWPYLKHVIVFVSIFETTKARVSMACNHNGGGLKGRRVRCTRQSAHVARIRRNAWVQYRAMLIAQSRRSSQMWGTTYTKFCGPYSSSMSVAWSTPLGQKRNRQKSLHWRSPRTRFFRLRAYARRFRATNRWSRGAMRDSSTPLKKDVEL